MNFRGSIKFRATEGSEYSTAIRRNKDFMIMLTNKTGLSVLCVIVSIIPKNAGEQMELISSVANRAIR